MWFVTRDLIWMVVTLEGHGEALIFIDKHQRLILLFLVGRPNHLEEIEDPTLKFVSAPDSAIMMKWQFRRLQRKTAATCGLGYCLKDFADISCYYTINHKIRHLGNTRVTIVAFIRILQPALYCSLFNWDLNLSQTLSDSYSEQTVCPKESQCWQIRNEWRLLLMLYEVASLYGVNYKPSHITLQGEKGSQQKNTTRNFWENIVAVQENRVVLFFGQKTDGREWRRHMKQSSLLFCLSLFTRCLHIAVITHLLECGGKKPEKPHRAVDEKQADSNTTN